MKTAIENAGFALALSAALLGGCGEGTETQTAVPEMPAFDDPRLAAGRAVWMGTCRACHLLGVAGAPAVTDEAQWDARLPKGRESLYRSALNGIPGEDGAYRMPPRGGNARLTEEQVRSAVDYKLAAIDALRGDSR
jgi:cytochrome c5